MVLNLKIPAIRGAIVRKFEPMIYHRQWQRDRKKYHLISQMSNSPLRNIFRFNLSSLLSGFARWRGGEGGGGETRGKKKRKIYTKEEEDSRIINAYDKAPLRHISPDTGVINFARRRKTIDRSPEVSLGVTRGVNIRRAGLRYSRIRYNHDPV